MSLNHDSEVSNSSAAGLSAARQVNNASKWRMAAVLLAILLTALSVIAVINHIGVRVTGDVWAWRQWMQAHAVHFFIWRLFLYGATASGWFWVRRRKLQRFPTKEMNQQMLRTEIFIIAFIAIFEIHKWLLRA
jgi:hypothetical protein